MTEEQREHIEQKIKSGYKLSSSVCLAAGFQMYKKEFFLFALYALIVPILAILFGLVGMGLIGTLALALIISPVLNAGLYQGAHQVANGEPLEYGDFFKVLPKAPSLIVSNLSAILLTAIILMPVYYIFKDIGMFEWYQAVAENPTAPPEPPVMNSAQSSTFFLNMIPLLYLQVGFSWAFLLILFYNANPFSALELSRRLITRRWSAQFMLLLTFMSILMVASMLLSGLTAISVGMANLATIGLFLILPWAYCSLYIGFTQALVSKEED